MKIGIVTFHWGTNYGGVLQTFALQSFLEAKGHEVRIINFAPMSFRDSILRCFRSRNLESIFSNIKNYIKDRNIDRFRKENLNLTARYFSLDEVKANTLAFDCLITGSDQVWNPYGIESHGLVYFLPFGREGVKKISYAASFGCIQYPIDVMTKIKPLLNEFSAISVREKTGLSILNDEGFYNLKIMPDPTLLLDKKDYADLMAPGNLSENDYCFCYSLQHNQKTMKSICSSLSKKIKIIDASNLKSSSMGIEHWLRTIHDSEFVITNSFHGVVFSLIFNKNFIVVPIEGPLDGMNDRIYTLLDRFNLRDRLVDLYAEDNILQKIDSPINWNSVEEIRVELKEDAHRFFSEFES
ncbi:polysaccharide pyruvyl transferase family protein [Gammaproteobacteria bacterium]|nr:polysaccharide pyruvyl transferase family protein [Gammaproteobacteria bacterium]